jgi:hypothetical protein
VGTGATEDKSVVDHNVRAGSVATARRYFDATRSSDKTPEDAQPAQKFGRLQKFNPHHDERGRFATADATSERTPSVEEAAYPGDFHDQVLRDELDQYLNTGARCVSEVRLEFGDVTARLDILCVSRAGLLLGTDVKTGDNPSFTPEQAFVYSHALIGAGVTSPDSKISELGFPRDSRLPPFPIFVVYVKGPGEQKHFFAPRLEPQDK